MVADFSGVTLDEFGPDRVAVAGASGHPATGKLKVSVGYHDGWLGEGQITYAGANCVARGQLALEIVRTRLAPYGDAIREDRGDLIGHNSVAPKANGDHRDPPEVRLRYAARCAEEVESLYLCGPAGGGGVTRRLREILGIASTLVPRELVQTRYDILEAADETA